MNNKPNIISEPCPLCGSNDIIFIYKVSYGHGDSGFTGSCQCQECKISAGKVSDYDRPKQHHIDDAFKQFNEFSIKYRNKQTP